MRSDGLDLFGCSGTDGRRLGNWPECTEGFTKVTPSILTGVALIGSMALLGLAVRHLPIGTAYAIWVGRRSRNGGAGYIPL